MFVLFYLTIAALGTIGCVVRR